MFTFLKVSFYFCDVDFLIILMCCHSAAYQRGLGQRPRINRLDILKYILYFIGCNNFTIYFHFLLFTVPKAHTRTLCGFFILNFCRFWKHGAVSPCCYATVLLFLPTPLILLCFRYFFQKF